MHGTEEYNYIVSVTALICAKPIAVLTTIVFAPSMSVSTQ